jgi:hypothetical protein
VRSRHLSVRFFGALRPGGPSPPDTEWVADILPPAAFELWSRQPGHDRRHTVAVAREVDARLAGTSAAGDPRWLAAALLHDVGKVDSRLGVYGRVVATLSGAVGGRDRAYAWSERGGFTRRVGLYLRHPEIGAVSIRLAGGPEEAAVWAAVHHDPPEWVRIDIPSEVVAALDAADND